MPTQINIEVDEADNEQINIRVGDVIASAYGGSAVGNTILFEGIVGGEAVLTGTANSLTGFDEDSDLLTLPDFVNVRVEMQRGGQDTPTIGPYAGFTKDLNSDSILLVSALELGEYIKIKTIPK